MKRTISYKKYNILLSFVGFLHCQITDPYTEIISLCNLMKVVSSLMNQFSSLIVLFSFNIALSMVWHTFRGLFLFKKKVIRFRITKTQKTDADLLIHGKTILIM